MAQETHEYLFGGEFAEERARLAGIESLWDPGSQSLLEDLGLGAGWRCLEVGAGGGSLVNWMSGRQGAVEAGVLAAADADAMVTRFADERMQVFTPVLMAGIGRRAA